MTYARAHLVDAENGGFYHCTTRCVRRAWLCGSDSETGRDYTHRQLWVESRLLELADVFAITVYAYAVMSNHYHVVLNVDPERVQQWDDQEVARRWLALSPNLSQAERALRERLLAGDAARIAQLRIRLGSLSWFMRYLNESLARRANREDGCTGRFWQGRFDSRVLLDEAAVLACMAYVDMNPIRAGIVDEVERSPHTSIARRLAGTGSKASSPLAELEPLDITLAEYRALLGWSAAVYRGSTRAPPPLAVTSLQSLRQAPDVWLGRVKANRFKYRAYGALSKLRAYAEGLGQQWLKGMGSAAFATR